VIAAMLATSASPVRADRWKLADDGSCYFDPADSGPDQCMPTPGRYKLDGNGTCYYDADDAGPNQCSMDLR
jgi:hypothetical protein